MKCSSQKGFVLVLFVFLLPLVLALGFALAGAGLLIRDRRTALNNCRADLLDGLARAAEPMQKLLALNPRALDLQAQYVQAKIAFDQAVASGHPIAIAAAGARLAMVRGRQYELDAEQRLLFQEARAFLISAQQKAYADLRKPGLLLKIQPYGFTEGRPALHPQNPGPAPVWAKDAGFSDVQTLQQSWTWSYKIQGTARPFLHSQLQRDETCAATIDDQSLPWRARLQSPTARDRFLSSL